MGKRREITPEAAARKEMIRALLKNSDVNSVDDVMGLFKEAVAEFLNGSLQEEIIDSASRRPRARSFKATFTVRRPSAIIIGACKNKHAKLY